jgi:hypothetical protein
LEHETVAQIACGLTHSLLLTENGVVYSMGENESFQLGHSHKYSFCNTPRQVEIDKKITGITCGQNFSVVTTGKYFSQANILDSNRVFLFGYFCNKDHKRMEIIFSYPTTVVSSHASEHVITLDNRGTLFGLGENSTKQLGLLNVQYKEPTRVDHAYDIQNIALGCNCTFLLYGNTKQVDTKLHYHTHFVDVNILFQDDPQEPPRKRIKLFYA